MFDITLFPFTSLLLAVAYPIFIRYVLLPIAVFAKLQNLVLISLYQYTQTIREFPFINTNKAIFKVMCFVLWLGSIIRFILKKRVLVNFLPKLFDFSLNVEIYNKFNKGCGYKSKLKESTQRKNIFPVMY